MIKTTKVIFESRELVGVANIISGNRKTGPMAQVTVLPREHSPMEDEGIAKACLDCPLSGLLKRDPVTGKRQSACYVRKETFPLQMWKAYHAGKYEVLDEDYAVRFLRDSVIRWGAWGEPVLLPYRLVERATLASNGWTGYTHQTENLGTKEAKQWSQVLMGSASSLAEYDNLLGRWRPFLALPKGVEPPKGSVLCPATRTGNAIKCIDCKGCSGWRFGAMRQQGGWHTWAHGNGAKYL